jgi:hypothetical protein
LRSFSEVSHIFFGRCEPEVEAEAQKVGKRWGYSLERRTPKVISVIA